MHIARLYRHTGGRSSDDGRRVGKSCDARQEMKGMSSRVRNAWYDHLTAVALNHVARPSTTADAWIARTRYLPGGSAFDLSVDLSVPALQKTTVADGYAGRGKTKSTRRRMPYHVRKRLGAVHGDLAP